jgi:hypothetical protein
VPPLALPQIHREAPPQATPIAVVQGVEQDVLALLSALYNCNAIDELCQAHPTVDMRATVQRVVDPVTLEVRLDVDTRAAHRATIVQANRWIYQGMVAKALRLLRAAARVFPHDDTVEFNMACAAALRGEIDLSLDFLEAAIRDGFRNEEQIRSDEDLAAIRMEPRYAAILAAAFPTPAREPEVAVPQPQAAVPSAPEPIAVAVPPPLTERTQAIMSIFPQLDAVAAKLLLERHRNVVALAVDAKLSE